MPTIAKKDEPIEEGANKTVLEVVRMYKKQAEDAKLSRKRKSEKNMGAYLGQWDWSHKTRGQSREAAPKIAMAAEQMSAFVKRAMVQFGDWFSVELPENAPISPQSVVNLLRCELDNLPTDGFHETSFAVVLGDAVKAALFESLVTMKVYGQRVKERDLFVERGNVKIALRDGPWRLRVDGIRPDDYFPDPTGQRLYKIHSVERDLHEVYEMAKQGAYDIEEVKKIDEHMTQEAETARTNRKKNQDTPESPMVRRRVVLDEMWGTLVNEGRVVKANIITTVANGRWLIREPIANPWWHQEDPFIDAPLIRVPGGSVWHKALYDDAVGLNIAINEMLSLIVDGGLNAVWGLKQLRSEWLKNPGSVSAGIPPGMTLDVSADAPASAKVVQFIETGKVPQDAIATLGILFREFNAATLENEITLGQLPGKQVLATEINQASESQAITLGGIIGDTEQEVIKTTLRKSWLLILQNIDRISIPHLKAAMSNREIMALLRMPPRERFLTLGTSCIFKVHGLSATLARGRDFQKMMALLSVVGQNPMLLQRFIQDYDTGKVIRQMIKMLNINPETIRRGEDAQQGLAEELKFAAQIQALTNPNAVQQGSDRTEAQIQNEAQPQQI